ncbi:MAG: hypothetical protein F6K04_23360, partial [Leptolyngbya sp. SIO4C5]|nr:hypothetical protein [Leptolyngbya sp. SIO4C5]
MAKNLMIGKHFSQREVAPSFEAEVFGQVRSLRVVLIGSMWVLSAIAGSCIGVLGGFTSLAIFSEDKYGLFLGGCMAAIAAIWVVQTTRSGVSRGVWSTLFSAVIFFIFSVIIS